MAFNIDYMARVSTSANSDSLKVWVYNGTSTGSDETAATIIASGYFDPFQQNLASGNEAGPLLVDDVILVHGNDASGFYKVSSITTNVTLETFAADGSVSLDDLDSAIQPSHVVKFADEHTTAGGSASEAISVPGVLATDLVFAQLHTEGATPRTIVTAVASADTVTIEFSADPSTDHVVAYQVLRATS